MLSTVRLDEKAVQNLKCSGNFDFMPAIRIPGSGYRFQFYSNEKNEPAHVHVTRGGYEAKFWIVPVSLARNDGFAAHELNKIKNLVRDHEDEIRAAWNRHFPA